MYLCSCQDVCFCDSDCFGLWGALRRVEGVVLRGALLHIRSRGDESCAGLPAFHKQPVGGEGDTEKVSTSGFVQMIGNLLLASTWR